MPGRFKEFSGTIQYDSDKIANSSVTFTAKAASIDTGVEPRDNHLRSADFFNVAQYPEITFKSTKIEKKNQNDFVAYGDFTLHGVTKQIAIPFTLYGLVKDPWGKTFEFTAGEIRITRYGWDNPKAPGFAEGAYKKMRVCAK